MRSLKWAVVIVAASSLMGCDNSQPSLYRVAVDRLTAENIPPTCYRTGQAPTTIPDKSSNLVDQQQWVVWAGLEDTVYLETGAINYGMGQAERVVINGDAIQGSKDDGKYTFTSERVRNASATETYTTSASYTIDKLGDTLEGSLTLHSACSGADCGTVPTCDITLTFAGRKIEGDQLRIYTNNPSN